MPDEVFNFRWSVDTAGYEFYETQPIRSIIDRKPMTMMRGRGGDLRWYNPLIPASIKRDSIGDSQAARSLTQ